MRRAKEYDMNEKSSKETKKHGSLGGGGYHMYLEIFATFFLLDFGCLGQVASV